MPWAAGSSGPINIPMTREPLLFLEPRGIERRYRQGESYYKKSLQIQPQQPVAANNLAYQMLLDGNMVDEALALAQTPGKECRTRQHGGYTGMAYYCKGTYEFARDLLEDAINAEPGSGQCNTISGWCMENCRITIRLRFT